MTITINPIGYVKNSIKSAHGVDWSTIESEIIIYDDFASALDGIEDFNYIEVIFWMHLSPPPPSSLKIHPRGRRELPLLGIFATRSPIRPNPIGVSVVKLIRRCGNKLIVLGLDALDGSPVLDIKPFIPIESRFKKAIKEARVPTWVRQIVS